MRAHRQHPVSGTMAYTACFPTVDVSSVFFYSFKLSLIHANTHTHYPRHPSQAIAKKCEALLTITTKLPNQIFSDNFVHLNRHGTFSILFATFFNVVIYQTLKTIRNITPSNCFTVAVHAR